jgi:hypothetical protein
VSWGCCASHCNPSRASSSHVISLNLGTSRTPHSTHWSRGSFYSLSNARLEKPLFEECRDGFSAYQFAVLLPGSRIVYTYILGNPTWDGISLSLRECRWWALEARGGAGPILEGLWPLTDLIPISCLPLWSLAHAKPDFKPLNRRLPKFGPIETPPGRASEVELCLLRIMLPNWYLALGPIDPS